MHQQNINSDDGRTSVSASEEEQDPGQSTTRGGVGKFRTSAPTSGHSPYGWFGLVWGTTERPNRRNCDVGTSSRPSKPEMVVDGEAKSPKRLGLRAGGK